MFPQVIEELHQHCKAHFSFKELASKLNWSSAQLASFFAGQDTTLNSVMAVGHAMNLHFDVVFTKKEDNVVASTIRKLGE